MRHSTTTWFLRRGETGLPVGRLSLTQMFPSTGGRISVQLRLVFTSRPHVTRERGGRLSWVASRPRHAAVIIGSLFTACYTLRQHITYKVVVYYLLRSPTSLFPLDRGEIECVEFCHCRGGRGSNFQGKVKSVFFLFFFFSFSGSEMLRMWNWITNESLDSEIVSFFLSW